MESRNSKLMSMAEYAAMRGLSRQTVYKQARQGRLTVETVNGHQYIRITEATPGDNQGDSFVNQGDSFGDKATAKATQGDSFTADMATDGDSFVNQATHEATEKAALDALQAAMAELRATVDELRKDKAELQRQMAEQRAFYEDRIRHAEDQAQAMAVNMHAQLQALKRPTIGERLRGLLGKGEYGQK